ncbi:MULTISPECIES: 6-phosphofructokinase [Herpetosiphon]|uniref:ATP-dependent 6-phosphofructokinase n=1 Tax=Herpetosiphon geysericola TaxID=70996 RepID=A0A0P6YJL9_9CHLR|nr:MULTISPECIES: 6-phosphofructokinase [Herpetosiphon]KPL85332.1 6-phosphofructokinase [Herpetosiphon geysericola]MBM7843286.1 6-phosphofructokinase 1 [Herpetosiphon giganteus]
MHRIAVLTSGGDSPGMNPAIRAVTRTALHAGCEVFGVYRGYAGLIQNDMRRLEYKDVGGIIQRGGTMLLTARSPEFMTPAGREKAIENLRWHGIEGLVVIGGDGSLRGAAALTAEHGLPTICLPGTIDNDMYGTDMSIGADTALNTVLEAIDKIKDTASSHQRAFIIETMGRHSGYLALMGGLAGGAEAILIPEIPDTTIEDVVEVIKRSFRKGKTNCVIVAAEGAHLNAQTIQDQINQIDAEESGFSFSFRTRATILGHIQRGGSPSAFDRTLATRLGSGAVEFLLSGKNGGLVGVQSRKLTVTPYDEVLANPKVLDAKLYELSKILDRY